MGKRDLTTKWGDAKILTLKDRNGESFNVWATQLIRNSINEKWNEKTEEETLFIKAIAGKKKCKTGPFSYFDYKYKIVK